MRRNAAGWKTCAEKVSNFRSEAGLRAELRACHRTKLSGPNHSSAVWSEATETKEERLREERSRLLSA